MPIIQYVLPSKNKALKKLLHFYWEVCPKYDENGKLKQEMILVVCVITVIALISPRLHPPVMQFATIWSVRSRSIERDGLECNPICSNIQMSISVVPLYASSRRSRKMLNSSNPSSQSAAHVWSTGIHMFAKTPSSQFTPSTASLKTSSQTRRS